jgi:hypothetical protein
VILPFVPAEAVMVYCGEANVALVASFASAKFKSPKGDKKDASLLLAVRFEPVAQDASAIPLLNVTKMQSTRSNMVQPTDFMFSLKQNSQLLFGEKEESHRVRDVLLLFDKNWLRIFLVIARRSYIRVLIMGFPPQHTLEIHNKSKKFLRQNQYLG